MKRDWEQIGETKEIWGKGASGELLGILAV
jgi:hypothetical protein